MNNSPLSGIQLPQRLFSIVLNHPCSTVAGELSKLLLAILPIAVAVDLAENIFSVDASDQLRQKMLERIENASLVTENQVAILTGQLDMENIFFPPQLPLQIEIREIQQPSEGFLLDR
ncbi:MAG: hypothetical protein AAGD01_02000 [Acidobacteriota bacterium]